jgi:hypothetical protein
MAEGVARPLAVVALGCAGWGAGQLESELAENSWLTVPADAELLFDTPLEQRWRARRAHRRGPVHADRLQRPRLTWRRRRRQLTIRATATCWVSMSARGGSAWPSAAA